ncbi:MAG: hypothetical protein LBP76_00285 [Treponema sp.]|nr:hypothetical protein [Treponema sp.]
MKIRRVSASDQREEKAPGMTPCRRMVALKSILIGKRTEGTYDADRRKPRTGVPGNATGTPPLSWYPVGCGTACRPGTGSAGRWKPRLTLTV